MLFSSGLGTGLDFVSGW